MKLQVHLVAGARPNFMKVGPVFHALAATGWAEPVLVHTGQHFSPDMSDVFVRDLRLPTPRFHLQASGDTHAEQTSAVLLAYEALCQRVPPDWVVVVGDVNSTLAACLAAKKLNLPVAHLEAGLRSGDRSMPEEINRLAVDAIADLLWTPSADADANLNREGVPSERIDRVGNVMIDAYCLLEPSITAAGVPGALGLSSQRYVVATLHRPVNVDGRAPLSAIVAQLARLQGEIDVVFAVHPRTRQKLVEYELWDGLQRAGVRLLSPLGYVDFMSLVGGSALVITDSGGVQEETTFLGIPCLTARETTERPITVTHGTNRLVPIMHLVPEALQSLSQPRHRPSIPLWDGTASQRIVESLGRHVGISNAETLS